MEQQLMKVAVGLGQLCGNQGVVSGRRHVAQGFLTRPPTWAHRGYGGADADSCKPHSEDQRWRPLRSEQVLARSCP